MATELLKPRDLTNAYNRVCSEVAAADVANPGVQAALVAAVEALEELGQMVLIEETRRENRQLRERLQRNERLIKKLEGG